MNPAEFLARYREAKRQTVHQILGLSRSCSSDEARAAYRKLVREFHPDRFAGEPYRYLQKEVNDFFVRINQAYETVRSAGPDPEPDAGAGAASVYNLDRRRAKAKQHFLRGLVLLQDHLIEQAIEFFELALSTDPSQSQYHAQAAHAMLSQRPQAKARLRQIEILFKTAIDRDPTEPSNFHQLGRLHKLRGDSKNATRLFACAAVLQPDYHEAVRELRLLQMRRDRASGAGLSGAQWLKRLLKTELETQEEAVRSRGWQTDRRKLGERRVEQVPIPFPDRRMADRRREIRRLSDLPIDRILKGALDK